MVQGEKDNDCKWLVTTFDSLKRTHRLDRWPENLHDVAVETDQLIQDKKFLELVIPETAGGFAARLSRVMRTLLPSDDITWRKRRHNLADMFEVALKLKASTIGIDQIIKLVVFPPGTAHDQKGTKTVGAHQFRRLGQLEIYDRDTGPLPSITNSLLRSTLFLTAKKSSQNPLPRQYSLPASETPDESKSRVGDAELPIWIDSSADDSYEDGSESDWIEDGNENDKEYDDN